MGQNISKRKIIKTSLIFLILNSLISYIIGFKFIKYTGAIEGVIDFSYVTALSVSHLFLLTHLIALIIIPLILILPKKNLIKCISICLGMLFLFTLYVDAVAFEQYRFHINKFIINMIIKGGKGIFHFDTKMYFIMGGLVLGLLTFEFLLYFVSEKLSSLRINKKLKYIYIIIFSTYLICNIMYAGASAYYFNPITKHNRLYPFYMPLTANRFLRKLNIVDVQDARANLKHTSIKNTNLNYPKSKLVFSDRTEKQKNIIYICIDAWRFDCMNEKISPNIYSLKEHSHYFRNHFSGSNGTRGGIFSIFYGLPSIYWDNMENNCISPVFINTLKKKNFQFGIFSTATLATPSFDRTVFSNIKDLETKTNGNRPSEGDFIVSQKFNRFIDSISIKKDRKPFFGFLFYDSAHGYDYPDNYKTVFNPSLKAVNYLDLNNDYDKTAFFNRYKNCVHYVDEQIAKVISKLKEKKMLENTIIVITGDHAQEFNDNKKNYWGHGGNFSKYQIKVPMIIFDTDNTFHEYTQKTSHFDIAPTILSKYLNCTNDSKDYSLGKDLYKIKDWDYIVSGSYINYGIITKDQIITKYYSGDFELTDKSLNVIDMDKLDFTKLNKIMKEINSFYQK